MYKEYEQAIQLLIPIVYVLGGLIVGLILEKVIIKKIRRLINTAINQVDNEIVKSTRGSVTFLFVAGGAYGAILSTPMQPSLQNVVHKFFWVLIIIAATVILDRFAEAFVKLYSGSMQGILPATSIFINITRMTIFVVGILILLAFLGISIAPILTALGVGGIAVALALQDTLSNLFSGLQLIAVGQFKLGEYIKLSTGEEGYVEDINWRNTTIKTISNNFIVVPNAKMATSILTNYSRPEKIVPVSVIVVVGYESDLEKVERITLEVAREIMNEISGGVSGYEPVVRYDLLAGTGVRFTIWMQAEEFVNQSILTHEFIKRLHERYKSEDIELMPISRTVYVKEGK